MRSLFKSYITPMTAKMYRMFNTRPTIPHKQFDHERHFEIKKFCMPNCYMVIKINGENFSKFSEVHEFQKPNDIRALKLMNFSAMAIMKKLPDIVVAYGKGDEYSFALQKKSIAYERQALKLTSCLNGMFSTAFMFHWPKFFSTQLKYPPLFSARCYVFPDQEIMKDYLSRRQTDCQVNNLNNTCIWNLVKKKNMTPVEAQKNLQGKFSSEKKELLLHTFNIKYDEEDAIFRNGSTIYRKPVLDENDVQRLKITVSTDDRIRTHLWAINL